MSENATGSKTISGLDLAKQAAMSGVEQLRATDEVAVLAFDDKFNWVIQRKNADDIIQIQDDISTIGGGGGTSIYPAFQEACLQTIKSDAKIILSGATGTLNEGEELECERLYSCAIDKYHMPPELFLKECKATNTYFNFLYSKELIQQMGGFDSFSSILCIGKAFMLRRASMYAAKLDYPIEKMQYYGTVDKQGKNIGADCWWESETATERVMAEIKRIGEYFEKGDLSIF